VDTTFDRPVHSIAVIFEIVTGDGSANDIEMELGGATRPASSPPRIIVAAGRTVAVYDIVPDKATKQIDVAITVTPRIQLAGVIGSANVAAELGPRVASRGIDRLLQSFARPSRAVRVRWRWAPANQPHPASRG
jgi:hypothetical protein